MIKKHAKTLLILYKSFFTIFHVSFPADEKLLR